MVGEVQCLLHQRVEIDAPALVRHATRAFHADTGWPYLVIEGFPKRAGKFGLVTELNFDGSGNAIDGGDVIESVFGGTPVFP